MARAELVLGGAQFGLKYGITNRGGQPSPTQVETIIGMAVQAGVTCIDTAQAYGDSESRIGSAIEGLSAEPIEIYTKLSPAIGEAGDLDNVAGHIDASVAESSRRLGRQPLDCLMLHRSSQLFSHGGAIWQRLRILRDKGAIRRLGVSVQSPDELHTCLSTPDIDHIQLPGNILDWRWDEEREALLEARRRGVTIHMRSLYLQGLLLSRDAADWGRAHVEDPSSTFSWLDGVVGQFGRGDVAELCIAYALALPWVTGLVMGVECCDQLAENLRLCRETTPLNAGAMAQIAASRPALSEDSLNPATWR